MITDAYWIGSPADTGGMCPSFTKTFSAADGIKSARLCVSAIGVYDAYINGERIGDLIFCARLHLLQNAAPVPDIRYNRHDMRTKYPGNNRWSGMAPRQNMRKYSADT